jgi:hypothetical protein
MATASVKAASTHFHHAFPLDCSNQQWRGRQ